MSARTRSRVRNCVSAATGGGSAYDADAQAYINATGELFPDALNALVTGIKAAGLWDNHIGSIKKAIGVPSLAASMVDLRNPAFNGTPFNNPTHSATAGWGFTTASSQYINSGWQCGSVNSKGSLDSVHVGIRVRSGGGPDMAGAAVASTGTTLGFSLIQNGISFLDANNNSPIFDTVNPAAPGHLITSRRSGNDHEGYRDGVSIGISTTASNSVAPFNILIGARNAGGSPVNHYTGRITLFHAGSGLTSVQVNALTTLFQNYSVIAGEI